MAFPDLRRDEGLAAKSWGLAFHKANAGVTPRTESQHLCFSWLEMSHTHAKPQCLNIVKNNVPGTTDVCAVSGSGVYPWVQLAWGPQGASLSLLSLPVTQVLGTVRFQNLPFLLNSGCGDPMRKQRPCQGLPELS